MSIAWEEFSRTKRTRKRKPAPDFFSSSQAIDRKVKTAVTGLDTTIQRLFLELPTDEDRELVANFNKIREEANEMATAGPR
jgi:hypothetical protein